MKEKRIRAEVGYGYEDVLTDIATKHLIENTMVPLLRGGQTTEAVEAAARALQESLAGKSGTPISPRCRPISDWRNNASKKRAHFTKEKQ
jgi:uncharacterized membrane protein YgcG